MSLEKILNHYNPNAPLSQRVIEAEQRKDYGIATQLCYYEKYYFRALKNLSKEFLKRFWEIFYL